MLAMWTRVGERTVALGNRATQLVIGDVFLGIGNRTSIYHSGPSAVVSVMWSSSSCPMLHSGMSSESTCVRNSLPI